MAALLAGTTGGLRSEFQPGEKVAGAVSSITANAVFLDVGAKSEGVIDRAEFEQDGVLQVKVGDRVDAYFAGYDKGELRLTARLRSRTADPDALAQAAQSRIPVEGKVTGTCKGGFEVTMAGLRGFCPASQMDLPANRQPDDAYPGNSFTFLITSFDGDRNLVLSRRRLLEVEMEQQRQKLRETLKEGDVISGKVSRLAEFGAFVDIGAGVEGLIPMSELAWGHTKKAEDVVRGGDQVSVRVLKLEWQRGRISLSLRATQPDPWDEVQDKYHVGGAYPGLVTRLQPFGAFVALEPGVEGLLHISKLGAGRRLASAAEVLKEGQELEVIIEGVDLERERISLSLAPVGAATAAPSDASDQSDPSDVSGPSGQGAAPAPALPAVLQVGDRVTGKVEAIKPFGLFIKFDARRTGLLHVSELNLGGAGNAQAELTRKYPVGRELLVQVKQLEGERISLSLPQDVAGEAEFKAFKQQQDPATFGNLSDVFGQIKL